MIRLNYNSEKLKRESKPLFFLFIFSLFLLTGCSKLFIEQNTTTYNKNCLIKYTKTFCGNSYSSFTITQINETTEGGAIQCKYKNFEKFYSLPDLCLS